MERKFSKEEIINALSELFKPLTEETPEVFYNDALIDSIEKIKKL